MHFLGKFRIAQKLALGFGLVLSFCALLGVVSLYQLSLINQQLNLVANEDNKKLKMLDDLRFQLSTLRRGELTRTLVTSPATLQMLYNALDADIKKFAAQRSEYSSLPLSSEEAQLNRDLNDASNAFASHFLEAMELQKADRADEARLEVVTKGRGLCDAAAAAIAKSEEYARNSAEARAKKAASDYLVARTEILMLLAIVLATGVAFSIMITRGITRPLHLTEEVLQGLARGDLTNKAEVDSDDEAGAMSRSLNQTVESLREILASIASHGNRLATAVEEISATSAETSQNARTQSDQAELVATSMHEMSATVVEVSENSRRAANAASTACETARNGGHIVNEALVSMHAISASTETVAARISELGKGSEKIGVIAAVIDDIADQTNLLALNAAIEAARAGEQGRGFAVVADEVRKLAERTTVATKEIASMIEGIQNEAKEAVVAMQKGSAAVELGVQKTEASGKALEKIIEMASNVGDMVTQIATASSEQAATTEDVNRNISNIASMSGASSKSAEQTSSACSELSNLAIELQGIIGRFKLSVDEGETSSGGGRAISTRQLPFPSHGNLARDSQAGGRFFQ